MQNETIHPLIFPDSRGRYNAAGHLIALSVFGCFFVFIAVTMSRFVNPFDEGLILVGSDRVLSGAVPYRDFYAIYGPAQFYVLAALFKLFGPSVLVERLWDLLIRASTGLVVYLIIIRAWSRARAIIVAALTSLWLSYFQNFGYPIFPCLLFALLSLYCLIPVYEGKRGILPLAASGICSGITILFRHDVGMATAVGNTFTLVLFHVTRDLDRSRQMRSLLFSISSYAGGIALVVLPVFALFVAAGAVHAVLVNLVLIPARTYVRMRSMPFPSIAGMTQDILRLKRGWDSQIRPFIYRSWVSSRVSQPYWRSVANRASPFLLRKTSASHRGCSSCSNLLSSAFCFFSKAGCGRVRIRWRWRSFHRW